MPLETFLSWAISNSATRLAHSRLGLSRNCRKGASDDALNRIVQRTYPDDTTETFTYSKLSLTEQKDRLGRITRHFYDGFGRRTATLDPAGRTVS